LSNVLTGRELSRMIERSEANEKLEQFGPGIDLNASGCKLF
jgi:hypothetical protein